MPSPTFSRCQRLVHERGVDGVADVEELWEKAVDQLQKHHTDLRPATGAAIATDMCCVGGAAIEALLPGGATKSGAVADKLAEVWRQLPVYPAPHTRRPSRTSGETKATYARAHARK